MHCELGGDGRRRPIRAVARRHPQNRSRCLCFPRVLVSICFLFSLILLAIGIGCLFVSVESLGGFYVLGCGGGSNIVGDTRMRC